MLIRANPEHGNVLVLRSDMTVPIARLVATRYHDVEPPLRFCYFAHAYRGVRPQRGQSREFLQAGIELIGAESPQGTAEVLTILCDALDAAGLQTYRVGLGDAALYPTLLDRLNVGDPDRRERMVQQYLPIGRIDGLEVEWKTRDDRRLVVQIWGHVVDTGGAQLFDVRRRVLDDELGVPPTQGGDELLVRSQRAAAADLVGGKIADHVQWELGRRE